MEQELIKLGLQGGIAVSVLIALYFVLSKIVEIVKNRNGVDVSKKIQEIEENHLKSLENRVERLENLFIELTERVSRIEAKLNRNRSKKHRF
jgi:DNA-binding transcriptional MerR regulator